MLKQNSNKEQFLKINAAFEVLRLKNARKRYDILFNVLILKKKSGYGDEVIAKFGNEVDQYLQSGIEKGRSLLENSENPLLKAIKSPLTVNYIRNSFLFYSRSTRFIGSPLAGLLLALLGTILFTCGAILVRDDLITLGAIALIWGSIQIFATFRGFVVDLMNSRESILKASFWY
jgi:hypothetical protein